MSVYYYVVCHDHRERADAASRVASGNICHLADSTHTLLPFLVAHAGCTIEVVHESYIDMYGDYEEWTEENVAEKTGHARADQARLVDFLVTIPKAEKP